MTRVSSPQKSGRWYYTLVKVAKMLNIFIWQKKQPSPPHTLTHAAGCHRDLMHLLDRHQVLQVHTSFSTLWSESRVLFYRLIQNVRVIPSILFWTIHPSSVWHGVFLKEYFMRSLHHLVLVLRGHSKVMIAEAKSPYALLGVLETSVPKNQNCLLEETNVAEINPQIFP